MHDLLACGLGDGEAVKVPLRDGGGGGGALEAGDDAERPEVLEDEEDAEPPAVGVEDPFLRSRVGEVAGEEDALEHQHPEPGEGYDDGEGGEAEEDEVGGGGEDFGAEFEDADGAGQAVAVGDDAPGPEGGEEGGEGGEIAHRFVLEGGCAGAGGVFEAADEWVEGEGDEDDGHGEEDEVDEVAHVVAQEREPDERHDDGNHGVPEEHVGAAAQGGVDGVAEGEFGGGRGGVEPDEDEGGEHGEEGDLEERRPEGVVSGRLLRGEDDGGWGAFAVR